MLVFRCYIFNFHWLHSNNRRNISLVKILEVKKAVPGFRWCKLVQVGGSGLSFGGGAADDAFSVHVPGGDGGVLLCAFPLL